MKVKLICKWCGNDFYAYPSQNRLFCCQNCYTEWQIENKHGENTPNWNGGLITLICKWCGDEYTRNRVKVKKSHFCCQNCYTEWQSKNKIGEKNPAWDGGKNIISICKQCGNKYKHYKSNSKSLFCSKECFNKWQRLNTKKGIDSSSYGIMWTEEQRQRHSARQQGISYDEWESFISEQKYCLLFNEKFKEKIRERYNRKCFLCSELEKDNKQKLSVHHVNYNKDCLCGSICEFVPLCKSCHSKTNHNRKYWENLIMHYLYPERYFMIEL